MAKIICVKVFAPHISTSTRRSKEHGRSADEPQNRPNRQGDRRQYYERVSHCYKDLISTKTPELHSRHLDSTSIQPMRPTPGL